MRRLLILLLLLLTVSITQAQTDTTGDSWEIIERCIEEPTTPPDDWSYDGTIIMWGHFGLHGIHADWDTPRILAFLPDNAINNGSSLSPDGRYFAYVDTEFLSASNSQSGFGGVVEVKGIIIYDSTENTEPVYEIPIENSYSVHNRGWSVRQLHWLDENHIVYEVGNEGEQEFNLEYVKVIDITTGNQSDWEYPVNPLDNGFFYPSPDLQYAAKGSSALTVTSITTNNLLLDYENLNLSSSQIIFAVDWSPASDMAIVTTRTDESNISETSNYLLVGFYINRENTFSITIPGNDSRRMSTLAISPDSRYVAYHYETLRIVDLETQNIFDTCVHDNIDSLIWSSDSTQVAFYQDGAGLQPINVYDLERNQAYTVGYHQSSYFRSLTDWRED